MAHVSHKLSNSAEGALAGGGDPATSPLYVFGPFLRLIIVAGVAYVTFGATIWLVVFTIAMVSAMYRLVMTWVTDGSGGSGLSEEEFGGWAVKINAAITFVEYTLTFLVSMAAMVTFLADRAPILNESFFGIQYRTIVAIILSLLTGWLVNRGPKTAARAFGPATAGVLLLLWVMIVATIWKYGFHLPEINLEAFSSEYIGLTFAGFTRMLAVMTGIEVFANLVAAYDGSPKQRSNKAFGSLLFIMGTTAATMLIVGPAIFNLSNPTNEEVSVFTQTMDALLPAPLPYLGTLVGIAVLLSASAASAQGLQNLALGLKDRHYIPAFLGERNKYDVADKPVWLEVGLVIIIFLIAGTNEETYLAIYAAGVFILLSMTGWAASKRLVREVRQKVSISHALILIGTVIAATITSVATIVIFEERFFEGAWTYFVFIPLLYAGFTYTRNKLGAPSAFADRLGELEEAMLGSFGFGQSFGTRPLAFAQAVATPVNPSPEVLSSPTYFPSWKGQTSSPQHILVPLDGSRYAEAALPTAVALCTRYNAKLTLLSVVQDQNRIPRLLQIPPSSNGRLDEMIRTNKFYLENLASELEEKGIKVSCEVRTGQAAEMITNLADESDINLVIIGTHGRSRFSRWLLGGIATSVMKLVTKPVLIISPRNGDLGPIPQFKKILVTLDGSEFAERVLPYVKASSRFSSVILLLAVPQIPEADQFGAVVDEIQEMRKKAEHDAQDYLDNVACSLLEAGIDTQVLVTGSRPAETIVNVASREGAEVIMMATHGHGELGRLFMGSVAERVVESTPCPVFLVPIRERRPGNGNNKSTFEE
jgi:nucleotide-binding universal stress UspA family protein